MSLLSCVQTTSNYYYISLGDASDVKVTSMGRVNLKNLKYNSEIPVSYTLERESYRLHFLISDNSYFPHLKIVAESLADTDIYLRPSRDLSIISEKGVVCASYYSDVQDLPTLYFGWSSDCIYEDVSKFVSFDIFDFKNTILAKENIPFELKKNGKYTLLDAI